MSVRSDLASGKRGRYFNADRVPSRFSLSALAVLLAVSAAAMPRAVSARGLDMGAYSDGSEVTGLPVSPVTPPPGSGFSAAPVPGGQGYAPAPEAQKGAQLSPSLFGDKTKRPGEGYLNGSAIDPEKDHRPPAGVQLNLPFKY